MVFKIVIFPLILLLFLSGGISMATAQEIAVSPIVNDETGIEELGLSDLAIETGETDIELDTQKFAPMDAQVLTEEKSVFEFLNERAKSDGDSSFSPSKFRQETQSIPLGKGIKPAKQIKIDPQIDKTVKKTKQ